MSGFRLDRAPTGLCLYCNRPATAWRIRTASSTLHGRVRGGVPVCDVHREDNVLPAAQALQAAAPNPTKEEHVMEFGGQKEHPNHAALHYGADQEADAEQERIRRVADGWICVLERDKVEGGITLWCDR